MSGWGMFWAWFVASTAVRVFDKIAFFGFFRRKKKGGGWGGEGLQRIVLCQRRIGIRDPQGAFA